MSAYKFSKQSTNRLMRCHPSLKMVMMRAIEDSPVDFSVLCGCRGRQAQEHAYNTGTSKAKFGQSPHNYYPSFAVDIAPYPINWNDLTNFYELGNHVLLTAEELKIRLNWGGNWTNFKDYPHFELDNWEKMKGRLNDEVDGYI